MLPNCRTPNFTSTNYPKMLLCILPKMVFFLIRVDSICSYVFFSSASFGPQSSVGLSAPLIFCKINFFYINCITQKRFIKLHLH